VEVLNLECDNFHMIFKAKPDSRYINAIKDDNFEGNPEELSRGKKALGRSFSGLRHISSPQRDR